MLTSHLVLCCHTCLEYSLLWHTASNFTFQFLFKTQFFCDLIKSHFPVLLLLISLVVEELTSSVSIPLQATNCISWFYMFLFFLVWDLRILVSKYCPLDSINDGLCCTRVTWLILSGKVHVYWQWEILVFVKPVLGKRICPVKGKWKHLHLDFMFTYWVWSLLVTNLEVISA